jgi:hypothetical protein
MSGAKAMKAKIIMKASAIAWQYQRNGENKAKI